MTENHLDRLPESLRYVGDSAHNEIELLPVEPRDTAGEYSVKYEDDYIMLIRDHVKHPDGREGGYARIVNKGEISGSCGSVVIPLIENCVVFIEIFRHATRQWHWELPRGFQEIELNFEENARQELSEELSVDPVTVTRVCSGIHANTGMLSGRADVFVARIKPEDRQSIRVQTSEAIRGYRIVPLDVLAKLWRRVGNLSNGDQRGLVYRGAARFRCTVSRTF